MKPHLYQIMIFSKKTLLVCSSIYLISNSTFSQTTVKNYNSSGKDNIVNSISTAVPFLLIAPDSRGGAMGDAGAASSPDATSIHYNAAKVPFAQDKYALSVSYTPWLRNLVNDINLGFLSGFYRFNDRQAISGALRYFDLGNINFTEEGPGQTAVDVGSFNPYEMSLELSFAQKLNDNFSLAITPKFIYSNLTSDRSFSNVGDVHPGYSVAADLGAFYQTDFSFKDKDARLRLGAAITNIGQKISYTDERRANFIPTNLKVGAGQTIAIDDYNELTLLFDINKLLVPTNPFYQDSAGNLYRSNADGKYEIFKGEDPNKSVPAAIFGSFSDAPGGFQEELQELSYNLGFEYWYDKQFAFRTGYFYENPLKGNRQYFTLGAGLKYNIFAFDLAYLISGNQQNPLENTLRFTLRFNFADAMGDSKKNKDSKSEE